MARESVDRLKDRIDELEGDITEPTGHASTGTEWSLSRLSPKPQQVLISFYLASGV